MPDARCAAQTCVGACASRDSVRWLSVPGSRAAGVSAASRTVPCTAGLGWHPLCPDPRVERPGRRGYDSKTQLLSLTKSKTAKERGSGPFSGQGRSRRSAVSTGPLQIPGHPETMSAAAPGLLGHPRAFVKRLRSGRAGSGPAKAPLRPSLLPK